MVKGRNKGVIGASWKWKLGMCYPALLSSHGSMIMWTDHCKFIKDAGFSEADVCHVCRGPQGAKAQSLPAQGVATDIINVSDT